MFPSSMSISNTNIVPWYEYFKADGTDQSHLLLAVYGIRSLWAALGLLSNLSIVYVTWASKSLHGICNILIALESFFAVWLDISYFMSFAVFASGIKFITYRVCFPILIPESMSGNVAQMTMVLTGIDRFLCIVFPIWYKSRNKRNYLAFVGCLLTAYAIYQFTIYYIDFLQSAADQIMISCSTHELGQGSMGSLMNVNGLILSGILMTLYSMIFVLAFLFRPFAKTVNENNKKLIKSLIFIIGLNMVGVFIKCAMMIVFANYWKVDVFIKNSYTILMSFLTVAVYSANAPVLYIVSKEYRSKFNQQFPWLTRFFKKINVAASQPQSLFTTNANNIMRTTSTIRASQLFIRRRGNEQTINDS